MFLKEPQMSEAFLWCAKHHGYPTFVGNTDHGAQKRNANSSQNTLSPSILLKVGYTSDQIGIGIGIRNGRSLTIACKSKNEVVSGIRSETESKGSEGFLFLTTPLLLQSLTILCKLVKRNRKHQYFLWPG